MRLLHNILALAPCGKPQAAHFAHLVELLLWQPERVHFTNLERCGGGSARTHAHWFARDFPFARLAVAALGAAHPQPVGELLALDASFVPKSGNEAGAWAGFGAAWPALRAGARGLLAGGRGCRGGRCLPLQSPGDDRRRGPSSATNH